MSAILRLFLKRQLQQRGLSMRRLARLAGVDHSMISKVLQGKRRAYPDFLRAVAPHLGVPYEDLLVLAGFLDGGVSPTTRKALDQAQTAWRPAPAPRHRAPEPGLTAISPERLKDPRFAVTYSLGDKLSPQGLERVLRYIEMELDMSRRERRR